MIESAKSRKMSLAALATIIIMAVAMVLLAPEEQTIGAGIKVVYIHVALTWTGMLGFAILGLMGIGVLISADERLKLWAHTVGWVALGVFAVGFVVSAIAEQVNWGAVFWDEPRMRLYMNMLAVALIVQILNGWIHHPRMFGALSVFPVIFLLWSNANTASVLHPDGAVGGSSSSAIPLTFAGLTVLFTLASAWVVWQIRRGKRSD